MDKNENKESGVHAQGEPAVWQWRCCIGGVWGGWHDLDRSVEEFKKGVWRFNLDNGTAELRPLYAAPLAERTSGNNTLAGKLQAAYDKVKEWPERSATGFMDLLELRNLVPEAIEAIRSRSPAEKVDREAIAKAIYDIEPFEEGGEYVDSFQVSPGGKLSWEQAKARDTEFAPEYMLPITKFAYDAADAVLTLRSQPENDIEVLMTSNAALTSEVLRLSAQIEQIRTIMNKRDDFIVAKGLWSEFVSSLTAKESK